MTVVFVVSNNPAGRSVEAGHATVTALAAVVVSVAKVIILHCLLGAWTATTAVAQWCLCTCLLCAV